MYLVSESPLYSPNKGGDWTYNARNMCHIDVAERA